MSTDKNRIRQYITFRVDQNLMGMDILKVREINPMVRITSVQHAPEYIRGLMNLRGQILTIFDIGVQLGLGKRMTTDETHIIIFKHKNAGFLVDEIGDVIDVKEAYIETPPANMDKHFLNYMENIINLPGDALLAL
ncbi:MAG: hypothetical protein GY729_15200, partial [Desulfobacteraceae bacterium]|nr:hypothetical protein [Desulfobacteraceae bacterium]